MTPQEVCGKLAEYYREDNSRWIKALWWDSYPSIQRCCLKGGVHKFSFLSGFSGGLYYQTINLIQDKLYEEFEVEAVWDERHEYRYDPIIPWNDLEERTLDEVLHLLDVASGKKAGKAAQENPPQTD